jgi:hypothetical protein
MLCAPRSGRHCGADREAAPAAGTATGAPSNRSSDGHPAGARGVATLSRSIPGIHAGDGSGVARAADRSSNLLYPVAAATRGTGSGSRCLRAGSHPGRGCPGAGRRVMTPARPLTLRRSMFWLCVPAGPGLSSECSRTTPKVLRRLIHERVRPALQLSVERFWQAYDEFTVSRSSAAWRSLARRKRPDLYV